MLRRAPFRNSSPRGVAAVEFAVSISVLLLVVAASIEFVRLNMLEHCVDHASYLAARKGMIVGAKSDEIESAASDHLALFGVSGAVITINPDPISDETEIVQVDIDVPMTGNSWISPVYFGGTIHGRTRILADRAAADMSAAVASSSP